MNRIVLILSILFLSSTVSQAAKTREQQDISFEVFDNTVETATTHRSKKSIPIVGYFDSCTSTLCLTFPQEIGEVIEISITNSVVYYNYHISSRIGTIELPINGDKGNYGIVILCSMGECYEGEFIIE